MNKVNAWHNIPLEDYEKHMEHHEVAQAQLLNTLTKKYLEKYRPQRPLFLGVSGGNGLEHIDAGSTETVVGLDINPAYLEETRKRFDARINNLVLVHADIATSRESFLQSDFVWAALIFEYVDLRKGFEFISNNIDRSNVLVITVQQNNGNQSVSQTGVESVKAVKDIFKPVNIEELQSIASASGFEIMGREENTLPNGKVFFTFELSKD